MARKVLLAIFAAAAFGSAPGPEASAADYGGGFIYSRNGRTYTQAWSYTPGKRFSSGWSTSTPSMYYGTGQSSNYRTNTQTYGQFYGNSRYGYGQGYRVGPGGYRGGMYYGR